MWLNFLILLLFSQVYFVSLKTLLYFLNHLLPFITVYISFSSLSEAYAHLSHTVTCLSESGRLYCASVIIFWQEAPLLYTKLSGISRTHSAQSNLVEACLLLLRAIFSATDPGLQLGVSPLSSL